MANLNFNISHFFSTNILPNIKNGTSCDPLVRLAFQIMDEKIVSKKMVCSTVFTCKLWAVTYFGDVGVPEYSRYFQSINVGSGPSLQTARVLSSNNFGYMGNISYSRYNMFSPP
jgi:hypothetical protein